MTPSSAFRTTLSLISWRPARPVILVHHLPLALPLSQWVRLQLCSPANRRKVQFSVSRGDVIQNYLQLVPRDGSFSHLALLGRALCWGATGEMCYLLLWFFAETPSVLCNRFFPHLLVNNRYLNVDVVVDKTSIPLKSQWSFLTILVPNLTPDKCSLVIHCGFLFASIEACGLLSRNQSLNIKPAVRSLAAGKCEGLPVSLTFVIALIVYSSVYNAPVEIQLILIKENLFFLV